MKDVTGVVSRQGNVVSTTGRKGSISSKGMGVVMQILSQMYTNAPLAVLREYACNARDSHVAAGQSQPIEVSLPSDLQPTLLIQDHGLGLTEDEALTFFLEYGESTKRDSDEQVGAFGIGSKSAFTMGHQFVVTAVKDGRKAVILLSLDENSVCQADVIKSVETTEPNGVLISLAVEDVDTMRETAEFFFSFWERGTVLVDGEEPTPVWEGKTEINDHTWLLPEHEGQVIIAMGGVPYVLGRDIIRKVARDLTAADSPAAEQAKALVDWYSDTSLLFKVPIGACHIAPNREGLRDTTRSLETVKSLLTDLVTDLSTSVQAKVDAARSPWEASRILNRALDDLGPFKVRRDSIPFNGMTLKKEIEVEMPTLFLANKSWKSQVKVVAREKKFTISPERMEKVLVVTGVSEPEIGKVQRYAKRFIEQYTDEEGNGVQWILVSEPTSGEHEWFEFGTETGARTMTLEEYRAALRALRDSNPRTKTEPSYSTGWTSASRDLDDRDLLTDILSWGKDIIIFHDSARHVAGPLAREALEDYTPVVLLGTQSEAALRKRVAEDGSVGILENYREVVKEHARKVAESVTDDERAALGAIKWLDDHDESAWKSLGRALGGAENITSKAYHEAVEAFELARLVAADITNERKNVLAQVAAYIGSEIEFPEFEVEVQEPLDVYPLVGAMVDRVGYWFFERNEHIRTEALAYVNGK